MKIYTKSGDKGRTAVFGGGRVSKSDPRIEAYGNIDELNAHIGYIADLKENNSRRAALRAIQEELFQIGSALFTKNNTPGVPEVEEQAVEELEKQIDGMEALLPALKSFILPGGSLPVSSVHIARCICRRAERATVSASEHAAVPEVIITYLNRLSDYLFVLARTIAKETDTEEIKWNSK